MPLSRRAATVRTRRVTALPPTPQQQQQAPQQPEPAGLQLLPQPDQEAPNHHPAPAQAPAPAPPQGEARYRRPMVRLHVLPDEDHVPDNYGDGPDELGITPAVYQALERHLPPDLVGAPAEVKRYFMRSVLHNYIPSPSQRIRTQNQREYRERILSAYQPLHPELYTNDASSFILPAFLQAINGNTEESITSIMMEAAPGVYAFPMLTPSFCEMLMSEVNNFLTWAQLANQRIMRPTSLDKHGRGAALPDFGLQGMLDNLMKDFISPMSTVLFPEVGGNTLDSHHTFVVECGEADGAREPTTSATSKYYGFHVDDSEVTLNICLGKHFTGADMYFRGIRCGNHVNSGTHDEGQIPPFKEALRDLRAYSEGMDLDSDYGAYEYFVHPNVPGRVVLHHGSHRHGVFSVTSGQRINMVMWCKREKKKFMTDFSGFCRECQFERTARQVQHLQELTARISISGQESEDETP
uniref:Fe2OG dioxygenase domain-containing protein n=1 Tax=Oryza punctata TaxID=4537 RepID=A0A0E0JEX2_ORYPU